MEIISQVAEAMQEILTEKSDAMGRETGFIVRERKLSGSGYAQTLVFGWLSDPESTLEDLSQMAKSLGIEISSQGLDKRFSRESSEFMEQLLSLGIEQMIISDAVACSLMQRFNGVYIHDSSTIILPDELKEIWRGCGGSSCENTSSSVKIQLQLELTKGRLIGPELQDGREQDKSCSLYKEPLPRGSLCIRDLGYFSIENLKELDSKKVYWLSRMKSQVKIYWEGKCCSL
ncbi:MAG: IS4 family transposase, partial [Candidatus Desantisbacteria bacterium]